MPANSDIHSPDSREHNEPRLDTGKISGTGMKCWYWLPVAIFWLLLWQILYWAVRQDILLASPLQVLLSLFHLFRQSSFWIAVLFSLLRIETGFFLGLLFGTGLAVLTSKFVWVSRFIYPAISAIRSTPIASFIILVLFWMSSSRVVIFIVFLMVMPIVWTNVTEGIRKIDPNLLEMSAVFHLTRRQILQHINIPSVSPFFVASATTSLGLAWKAGIAAEVLSTPKSSLGGLLYNSKIYLETPELLAYTAVIILLSLLLEKIMVRVLKNSSQYFQQRGRINIPKNMSDMSEGRNESSTGGQV